jgi:hypothetical protein
MSNEPDEYLTITQAKDYLGVSEYKIGKLIYGDQEKQTPPAFPSIANPYREGSRLVKRSDLDAYLAGVPRRRKKHKQPPTRTTEPTKERPAAAAGNYAAVQ